MVYPGSIPQDLDILLPQQNTEVSIGYALQALVGQTTAVDGLVLSPTTPASLTVTVGPGSIMSLGVIDGTSYGSLAANLAPVVKQGVNTTATSFTLTVPPTSGQSLNYLIQAQILESDQVPVVLPYYNAANPSQPYTGPNNAGTSQNTQRNTRVQLQLKAGAPATAGSQTTPAVDAGWIGLYVITVSFGQSQITSANLANAQLASAPFVDAGRVGRGVLPGRLINVSTFLSAGTFTYSTPPGVNTVIVEVQGAGGGGGGSGAGASGAGGAGGGGASGSYGVGRYPVSTIGTGQTVTIGAGGTGGTGGVSGVGGAGGSSSFGAILSSPGGQGGNGGQAVTFSSIVGGGVAGAAPSGANLLSTPGSSGGFGLCISPGTNQFVLSGAGANSRGRGSGGGNVGATSNTGVAGFLGGGGSGACPNVNASSPAFTGGRGGDGFVIVWGYS